MSYQNGTTHYNLPQTVGTDKRDWSDTNQAFADVDAAIYNAVEGSTTANESIAQTNSNLETTNANVTQNATDIAALETRMTTAEADIDNAQADISENAQNISKGITDVEDMITAYNEASATSTHDYAVGDYFIYNNVLYKATAAISSGDTIVPNTNCSATNVSTELKREDMYSVDLPVQSGETWAAYLTRIFPTVLNLVESSGRAPLCCLEMLGSSEWAGYIHSCVLTYPDALNFVNTNSTETNVVVSTLQLRTTESQSFYATNNISASGLVSTINSTQSANTLRLYY